MNSDAVTAYVDSVDQAIGTMYRKVLESLVRGRAMCHPGFYSILKAEALEWGEPLGHIALVNYAYELSHLQRFNPLGCTSRCTWVEGSWIHERLLDWDLPEVKGLDISVKEGLVNKITWPGYVGVLQGASPFFSMSMNYASPDGMSLWGEPTTLISRRVMGASSYTRAVDVLLNCSPVCRSFYTLCGLEKDEACTVEVSPTKKAVVRPSKDGRLVQTNHSLVRGELDDEDILEDSRRRYQCAMRAKSLKRSGAMAEDTLFGCVMWRGEIHEAV